MGSIHAHCRRGLLVRNASGHAYSIIQTAPLCWNVLHWAVVVDTLDADVEAAGCFCWAPFGDIPEAHIVPAIRRHGLCRDPGYFEDFDNDPLTTNTQKVTARMGSETLRAMRALAMDSQVAQADSAFSQIPVLFLIGSADRVVCQRQGTRFFDRLASRDKEVKVFHGLYHCLLEDPEKDDVIRYFMQWLEQHFPER